MSTRRSIALALGCVLLAVGCSDSARVAPDPTATDPTASAPSESSATSAAPATTPAPEVPTTPTSAPVPTASIEADGTVVIPVDPSAPIGVVHPEIRGVSFAPPDYLAAVGATVDSWGGDAASRYDYAAGTSWNTGHAGGYRNTRDGLAAVGGSASSFLAGVAGAGAAARLTVPTLGWVAKDDVSCSFPDGAGGCDPGTDLSCSSPSRVADPNVTSVQSTPQGAAAWVRSLVELGLEPAYLAMDNEPELWGSTHYDVHPSCTTYEEILTTYTAYADSLREVAPNALFAGPVMCCWYSYWLTAPGPADGSGPADFLTWFLARMRQHDEASGVRTLDVLDVHYYPQSPVLGDEGDAAMQALRLRSTRSLWDPTYKDESWVATNIALLPRLRELIDATYPGTELGISEWSFGADDSMNGALAIADVLGIFGREGVDMASYWQFPAVGSPGYFAFMLHGNYDGSGGAFDGDSLAAPSPDPDALSSYAVVDPDSGAVKVLLINKQPDRVVTVRVAVTGRPSGEATAYAYGPADPRGIVATPVAYDGGGPTVEVPASSMVLIETAAG